jgi:TetR/AcrR family transcriptional regulator, repressor for neighboring sulfatase
MESSEHRPRGRDDVVEALVAAASELFADRGPAAVSLRDVAAEADVNLGLIHRYVGSKQDLLDAVLGARVGMREWDRAAAHDAADVVNQILGLLASDPAFVRVMLRTIVERADVRRLQEPMPLVDKTTKVARQRLQRKDADIRVAFLTGAALAWHAVAPVVLAHLQRRNVSDDDVRHALAPVIHAFLSADEG